MTGMMLTKLKRVAVGLVPALLALGMCAASAVHAAADASIPPAGLSRDEALRLGERMYREGILPSGEPLMAYVEGDVPVAGTQFSCVSCHLRSGIGSFEGGIVTPPTNWLKLSQPLYYYSELTPAERGKIPWFFQHPERRPAYTEKTVADAIRGGIDPTGRMLDYIMPRYELNEREMAILIYYLKSLSDAYPPGVTDTTIRFATVIAGDVTPQQREAMLKPLENYIRGRNSRYRSHSVLAKAKVFVDEMDLSYRRLDLDIWELKGERSTWRSQLEEYYRNRPVFALLAGISNGEWRPIHEFSEEHRIPCIFPITNLPVISDSDWYTLYFSKGIYQEGESAARYLARVVELPPDKGVVQVVQNTERGRVAAEAFRKTWLSLGRSEVSTRTLPEGNASAGEFLHRLTATEKPSVILIWAGPETVDTLGSLAGSSERPEMVIVSSGLMKNSVWQIPDAARDMTFITYPDQIPQGKARTAKSLPGISADDRPEANTVFYLSSVLTDTLMMMKRNYYRDYFLDLISMMKDLVYPYHPRISFGPGQRYASKGCFIVQLTHDAEPRLVKKSGWVIH
jgi:hypothetical protein